LAENVLNEAVRQTLERDQSDYPSDGLLAALIRDV
jgi:hypothetical protein